MILTAIHNVNDCTNFTANALKQSAPFKSDTNFVDDAYGYFKTPNDQLRYLLQKYYAIHWESKNDKGELLYNNSDFDSWLNLHRSEILPGSVVFYSHPTAHGNYAHAAIVSREWEADPDRPGVVLPRILEHSAPNTSEIHLPRFIDQTVHKVYSVIIVNPHWSK
jgi:hypothetical protein